MNKILFATGNPTKAKRFSDELLKRNIEIISLKDINLNIEVEENGKNAIENALIKARTCYMATGMTTLAMDDNLYLEDVPEKKQPGMNVRRVNGNTNIKDEFIKSINKNEYNLTEIKGAFLPYGNDLLFNKGNVFFIGDAA